MAHFSDSLNVTLTSNSSEPNKLVLGYDTYALQLQNIDPDKFKGQTFTVNLGSVEDAMRSEDNLQDSLMTSEMVMHVLDNSTAAVQLPDTFLDTLSGCSATDLSTSVGTLQRLSYAVFLSDILFQSQNQSGRFGIGSIIVSTRLKCEENITIINPIIIIFRTVDQVQYNQMITV